MNNFYLYTNMFVYPKALLLTVILVCCLLWLSYFLYYTVNNDWFSLKHLYYPYIIYSFFILLWILSNTFFQSKLIELVDGSTVIQMAKLANISSYIVYSSIFHFTCRLLSNHKKFKIEVWQTILLWIVSVYAIYINLFTTKVITHITVYSASHFIIYFGSQSPIFFSTAIIFISLSLFNLIKLNKSKSKLIRLKSIYMVVGMIIFMISTLLFNVILPYYFQQFAFTWLPPALSIIEVILMGYASICHKFYSGKYLLHLFITSFIILSIFLTPMFLMQKELFLKKHLMFFLFWTLLYSIAWNNIWKCISKYVSLFIYKSKETLASQIDLLSNDFQISINNSIKKLSKLLNIDYQSIIISDANSNKLYSSYLTKEKPYLLVDEIEYNANKLKDYQLDVIFSQMSDHNDAMILPLYDNNKTLAHLFITPNKKDGSLYSNEEFLSLKKLINNIQSYIYSDFHVRQSQAIAKSIAHEVRNPLAQIQLHLENIDALLPDKSPVRVELESARTAIYNGNQIIDLMLQENHKTTLESDTVKIYSISELVQISLCDYVDGQKSIMDRINFNSDNDFYIRTNITLFKNIQFNLLRNAIYYFKDYPNSTIEIYLETGFNKNFLHFKDSGPGIEAHIIPHIFNEFFTYKKKEGTGLGLSYCRRVMKLFNGQINCQSSFGQSTCFTLTFPKIKTTHAKKYTIPENLNTSNNLSELHILLVDDNPSQRLLNSLYLEQLGVQFDKAENGLQSIEIVQNKIFDLILMDVHMPVMDGLTASRKIKEIYPKLPIIALSGESNKEELDKINQIMDDRLSKPITKKHLESILTKWKGNI